MSHSPSRAQRQTALRRKLRGNLRRPSLTMAATLSVATLSAASALPTLSPLAEAQTYSPPQDPSVEENLPAWENPLARSTDPELGVKTKLSALKVEANSVTAELNIRNNTSAPLTDLSLRVLSQPAVENGAAVRSAQLANYGEYPESSNALSIPQDISPGQSQTYTLHILKESGGAEESSNSVLIPELFSPGSHPVMFALSGSAQSAEQQESSQQLVGVARTTISQTEPRPAETDEPPAPATPVTFVWPLASETHVLGGGTGEAPQRSPLYLTDEHLAEELAEGGRLRELLDTYRTAIEGPQGEQLRQASCVAVDPELLDTVDRMTRGYRVGNERPSPVTEPKQLRDSWGDIFGGDDLEFSEGTGAEAAKEWLADLKTTVDHGCSVALPYAGADLNTIAETQQDWLGMHALAQGPQIIHRILGVWPTQNVVIPDAGYLSPASTPLLRHAATQGAQVDLSEAFEQRVKNGGSVSTPVENPVIPGQQPQTVSALVAGNTVNVQSGPAEEPVENAEPESPITPLSSTDISSSVPPTVLGAAKLHAVGYSADLGSALQATGEQPSIAAYSDPRKRYDVEEDSPTARMAEATAIFNEEVRAGNTVLAVPPSLWSVNGAGASQFLSAISQSFTQGRAVPAPLTSVLQQNTGQGSLVEPYLDPGALGEGQAQRISEQATALQELTTTMHNDPTIALTRESFTRPLYGDLTRATSSYRLRVRSAWAESRGNVNRRLDEVNQIFSALRRSVTLVPPGNVFTRTSDSSPLLVLARNGLPLPVPITVDYSTESDQPLDLKLQEDNAAIPAKGSITVSLNTVDNAADASTNLKLWLASPDGTPITDPVDLRVQSVPGVSAGAAISVAILLVGIGIAGKIFWNRRPARLRRQPIEAR